MKKGSETGRAEAVHQLRVAGLTQMRSPLIVPEPKRHHYLPESYLEGFSRSRRGLWVYDIAKQEYRPQTAHDTCVQSYYNALEGRDGSRNFEIEYHLGRVESAAATIIAKLDGGGRIDGQEKADLAEFVSLQRFRTPEFETDVNKSAAHMMERLIRMAWADEERAKVSLDLIAEKTGESPKLTPNEMVQFVESGQYDLKMHRNLSLEQMMHLAPEFADYFVQMEWAFLRAPNELAFITTDSPFMLIEPPAWNENNPLRLGVGLLTRGARKLIPLSMRTYLVMFDRGDLLTYRDASPETVKGLNEQLAAYAFRFVIGPDENLLREICANVRAGLDAKGARWGGSKMIIG